MMPKPLHSSRKQISDNIKQQLVELSKSNSALSKKSSLNKLLLVKGTLKEVNMNSKIEQQDPHLPSLGINQFFTDDYRMNGCPFAAQFEEVEEEEGAAADSAFTFQKAPSVVVDNTINNAFVLPKNKELCI